MSNDIAELIVKKAYEMNLNEPTMEQECILEIDFEFEDELGYSKCYNIEHKIINKKHYVTCGQFDLLTAKGRKHFIENIHLYESSRIEDGRLEKTGLISLKCEHCPSRPGNRPMCMCHDTHIDWMWCKKSKEHNPSLMLKKILLNLFQI